MEDRLITFETAKLAKEKKFNEFTFWVYKNDKLYLHKKKRYCTHKNNHHKHKVRDLIKNSDMLNAKIYRCSAPTQSLLKKWLREIHGIFVKCSHSHINDDGVVTSFQVNITSISVGQSYNFKHHLISGECYGNTYEEALEKGLQESLKLIELT